MLADDLRGILYLALKDLRSYYLKPPNVSWGILFPFAFVLAFAIRNPGDVRSLVPGLVALTVLFGTTSMEAIVIVFERRIGSLERLLLAPMRLPALLAGKLLGGMVFGLTVTLVVLVMALAVYGAAIYLGGRSLIQNELRLDPADPREAEILDASIELLVKRQLAAVSVEEGQEGGHVYHLEPDWTAIRARLSAAAEQSESQMAEWFREGIQLIDETLLRS